MTKGNVCGYKKVTEYVANQKLGKTEYYYTTAEEYPDFYDDWLWVKGDNETEIGQEIDPLTCLNDNDFIRGKLTDKTQYEITDSTYDERIQKTTYNYKKIKAEHFEYRIKGGNVIIEAIIDNAIPTSVYGQRRNSGDNYYGKFYIMHEGYELQTKKTDTTYYENGDMSFSEELIYRLDDTENRFDLLKTINKYTNYQLINEYLYPIDKDKITGLIPFEKEALQKMYYKNIIAPIETKVFNSNTLISTKRINYKDYLNEGGLQTSSIEISNGSEPLTEVIFFDKYDEKGNILQYHKANNIYTSFLWSYNNGYPVAKIEGTEYETAINLIGDDFKYATENSTIKEKLDILRNDISMENAIVNTYIYEPLIGMISQTDANSKTTYYNYDSFGRLVSIKDNYENILKTYQYEIQSAIVSIPKNLHLINANYNKIDIGWDEESGAKFNLYRSANNAVYEIIATSLSNNNYSDNDVLANSTYSYKIKAFKDDFLSNFSTELTVHSASEAPVNIEGPLSVCNGSNQIYKVSPVTGSVNYEWKIYSTGEVLLGETVSVKLNEKENIISVKAINQYNVKSEAKEINITGISEPNIIAVSFPEAVYPFSTNNYSIEAVEQAENYSWTVPNNASYYGNNESVDITFGNNEGNVSVVVSNSCFNKEYLKFVKINSIEPTSITGDDFINLGQDAILTIEGGFLGTGAVWKWYKDINLTQNIGYGISLSVNPIVETTYYVRAEGETNITNYASKTVKINSIAATSIAGVPSVVDGCSTTLIVVDGFLGTDAIWKWYKNDCGLDYIGSGSSITVSPESNTTYYVRAEGVTNTTSCVSEIVTVNPVIFIYPNFDVIPATGETKTINIDNNGCGIWAVSSNRLWITVTKINNSSFTYTCLPNTIGVARSANISLSVDDNYENISIIQDAGLNANFTYSISASFRGTDITFTDTSSGNPTSWKWDYYNDGSINSILQNPTGSFTTSSFQVKLTVFKDGVSSSIIKTIINQVTPE